MDTTDFKRLLLKTAFSCMACDGDIDKREVELIKKLQQERQTFGELGVDDELNKLLVEINQDGHQFLQGYFEELKAADLSETNELKLIEVAIDTIKADDKVEYSEIKFFKVIRAKLKIDNEAILHKHPDFEDYLEDDIITDSYLARLKEDFFDTHIANEFEMLPKIDDSFLEEKNETD